MRHVDACNVRRFVSIVTSYGIVKERRHSHPGSCIRGDVVRDLVGRITIFTVLTPDRIIRRVVRQFRLIEIHTSSIGIPHGLELLVMLDKQPIRRNILAVDFDAGERRIDVPSDPATISSMIRPP
jgi:hypothetical protein